MSIITKPRKSSKAAKPFSCSFVSMTIEVNDTRYSVDQTDPGEFGTRSFRLAKRSGNHEIYDLVRTHAGIVECTCPDYEARHRGNGFGCCKHGKALVELGLMPAPIAPEFAPAKGVHTVNALPVVAPAPAPAILIVDNKNPAPIAPEPCCPESEPAPCLACIEAAPIARCVCEACVDDAQCVEEEAEDAGPAEAWGPEWDIDVWMLGADAPEPSPDWELNPDVPVDGTSAEDLLDSCKWAGETAAREFLNPAGPPTLTLAELVEHQVEFYLSFNTDAGDLIAGQLDQLASRIRFLDARSPAEFTDRCDVLDRDERDGVYRAGFDAGVAHARSVEVAGSAFGHSS